MTSGAAGKGRPVVVCCLPLCVGGAARRLNSIIEGKGGWGRFGARVVLGRVRIGARSACVSQHLSSRLWGCARLT